MFINSHTIHCNEIQYKRISKLYKHHEKRGLIHELSFDVEVIEDTVMIKSGKNKGKLKDNSTWIVTVSYKTKA